MAGKTRNAKCTAQAWPSFWGHSLEEEDPLLEEQEPNCPEQI
jgi:hypothetical protein